MSASFLANLKLWPTHQRGACRVHTGCMLCSKQVEYSIVVKMFAILYITAKNDSTLQSPRVCRFLPCQVSLLQQIDPLEEQDDFGRGLYLNAIRMVEQYLVHCSACGVFG